MLLNIKLIVSIVITEEEEERIFIITKYLVLYSSGKISSSFVFHDPKKESTLFNLFIKA